MKTIQAETSQPQSYKKHYALLDGLRGIAALAVLIFHYMEIIITDFSKNFIAHGFLAVDFFFCLSGFVIAYAYDDRMDNMHLGSYFKQRIKRLHPMVILGTAIGLLAFLVDPFGDAFSKYNILQLLVIFLCSALLIPYPTMEDRYFNNFGLNAPSWSLFWEYIANIVYALILVRLSKKLLFAIAILSAGVLIHVAKSAGNLLGGWNGETFWHGGARVLFSFVMGMCIFRYQFIIKNRLGFLPLSLLLFASFLVPFHDTYNWIVEPLIVIFYFPFLIALGAGSIVSANQEKYCTFSGNMSYPLYMTHYFVMWVFGAYYAKYQPATVTLIGVIVITSLLQLMIAYLAMKYWDEPIRRKIKNW